MFLVVDFYCVNLMIICILLYYLDIILLNLCLWLINCFVYYLWYNVFYCIVMMLLNYLIMGNDLCFVGYVYVNSDINYG